MRRERVEEEGRVFQVLSALIQFSASPPGTSLSYKVPSRFYKVPSGPYNVPS